MDAIAGDGQLTMLTALALAAAAPQPPRAFVVRLYAHYRDEKFSPLNHLDTIFAPPLAGAIRLDQKRAGSGYEGALEADPICDCQDPDELRADIGQPLPSGRRDRAIIPVVLRFSGRPHAVRHSLRLIWTSNGWRIADTDINGGKSLLAFLNKANAEAAGHR